MLFLHKLSAMTFDQGMPQLFLSYCEEHLEFYKGEGLCSAESPLDSQILTETVLAHKVESKAGESNAAVEKLLEAADKKSRDRQSSAMGEVTALLERIKVLERNAKEVTLLGNRGPPGPDNKCSGCGSEDHFYRECPNRGKGGGRGGGRAAADAIKEE